MLFFMPFAPMGTPRKLSPEGIAVLMPFLKMGSAISPTSLFLRASINGTNSASKFNLPPISSRKRIAKTSPSIIMEFAPAPLARFITTSIH
jgi:hypothetical protein